ncbi:MarR family transcriptional regulator [Nakamurella sp. YIM 132087]|uniref:MarR family transcriptional regulator n=1 Tax=Nakamurella alba TaxID=2665158 RepID=A0A7K1FFB4_9ACTN|nr:MarR family transcriptional regulator [Nakamurella alba]MTD12811.1 MarR family transcriptional regulator [Nakamurella alba]
MEKSATDLLVQTSFTVVAVLNQAAAENDLSLTQLRVLAILRDREPRMAALAAHLGLDKSSASGLVDRAVARGLVRRSPAPDDGRAVVVSLTDAGHTLAAEVSTQIGTALAPLIGRLGPADQRRLATLLGRLLVAPDA